MKVILPQVETLEGLSKDDKEVARELAWRICHLRSLALVKKTDAGEEIKESDANFPILEVQKDFYSILEGKLDQESIGFLATLPTTKELVPGFELGNVFIPKAIKELLSRNT